MAARTFTRATTIINLGHLPGHTQGKEALLRAHGYTSVVSLLCESVGADDIKRSLAAAAAAPGGAVFLVGGAMMQGFPDLMKELLAFVEAECPAVLVHKTSKPDFDEGVAWPPGPTEAQVNKSALNVCERYLAEGKTW